MKVIIIEDEKPAAEKLRKAIVQYDPLIEVVAVLTSVQASVDWLKQNALPQLVFMDIELTDGLSFEIFEKHTITCPIIFTTAYDDYWQEAFEYNSIDYLLKPLKQDKLEAALTKYLRLTEYFTKDIRELLQWHKNGGRVNVRKRFLVKRGNDYITINTADIACFYATNKLVCLVDKSNRKFILDKSLADLEKELDAREFYRVNRKYLVNITAIKRIKTYPKSKIQLEIEPTTTEDIIISQENVADFKSWMET
ncbi:MAG: LytTR family DNA-binding domain-containing protein [Ferruginibacter sp.]